MAKRARKNRKAEAEVNGGATAVAEEPRQEEVGPAAAEEPRAEQEQEEEEQAFFPGMEPVRIPEIERVAERYESLRDDRMHLQKEELKSHEELLALMQAHGLKDYAFRGRMVKIETLSKARVRKDGEGYED